MYVIHISKDLAVLSFETKIMSDRECQKKWLPINGFYRVRSHILGDILNFVSLMVIHSITYCTVYPTVMFRGFVWVKTQKNLICVSYNICTTLIWHLMSGSCHLDRASYDEFNVECLFWFFSANIKSRSERSTNY